MVGGGKKGRKTLSSYSMLDSIRERLAKLPPPPVELDIKAVKSDKRDEIVELLKSAPLELKAKRLPERYTNFPAGTLANTKIRVDNIPASVAGCWTFAMFTLVDHLEYYFKEGSNRYAFLTFTDHHNAKRFVERFNNKQIPETDMVYQLSWAPFYYNPLDDMLDEEGEDEDAEKENINQMEDEDEDEDVSLSADLCSKIRAFHEHLYEKPPAFEPHLMFGRVEMSLGFGDGLTTVLCLTMVDPGIERGFLEDIFEKYGKCTVHLPGKRGYGFVKFEERECAEVALAEIGTLLEDEHVCCLGWCFGLKEEICRLKAQERDPRKLSAFEWRIKNIEERESVGLCEERDGEEDAAVTTKTSKRSTSALNCASKAKRCRKTLNCASKAKRCRKKVL